MFDQMSYFNQHLIDYSMTYFIPNLVDNVFNDLMTYFHYMT